MVSTNYFGKSVWFYPDDEFTLVSFVFWKEVSCFTYEFKIIDCWLVVIFAYVFYHLELQSGSRLTWSKQSFYRPTKNVLAAPDRSITDSSLFLVFGESAGAAEKWEEQVGKVRERAGTYGDLQKVLKCLRELLEKHAPRRMCIGVVIDIAQQRICMISYENS